jgi:hypothetical protein
MRVLKVGWFSRRIVPDELDEGPQIPPPENSGGRHSRRNNGMNIQRFNKNASSETPSASSHEG